MSAVVYANPLITLQAVPLWVPGPVIVNLVSGLAAYWTLNESASGTDRADSVNGSTLFSLGGTEAGVPALFSNGVPFDGTSGGPTNEYQTSGATALAYSAGNGVSLFGWFKIISTGPGSAIGGPSCDYGAVGSFDMAIFVGDSVGIQPVRIKSSFDDAFVSGISTGAFHFFHIFYDPVAQQVGYSFDNGSESFLPTTFTPASNPGQVQLLQHFGGGSGSVIYDEIGVKVDARLTTTQLSYLWNGGAGRTWPIVLPP